MCYSLYSKGLQSLTWFVVLLCDVLFSIKFGYKLVREERANPKIIKDFPAQPTGLRTL